MQKWKNGDEMTDILYRLTEARHRLPSNASDSIADDIAAAEDYVVSLRTLLAEARAEIKHRRTDREMRIEHAKALEARATKAEQALALCDAERDELAAQLLKAKDAGESLYGMLEAHQANVDEYLEQEDQALADYWLKEISSLPARARQIMDIVEAAKKETSHESSEMIDAHGWSDLLEKYRVKRREAVRAHQQQDQSE